MVSAVSSTATTRTSSGSRVPNSSSTAPFGSSRSLCLKDSSSMLLCTSLRSISALPDPSLMRFLPLWCEVRRGQYHMLPDAEHTEDRLAAYFSELRQRDVGCIRARRKAGRVWERRPAKKVYR